MFTGRKINEVSIFKDEDEALLPPDKQFVVTGKPQKYEYTPAGSNPYLTMYVWVVELIEIHGEKLWY